MKKWLKSNFLLLLIILAAILLRFVSLGAIPIGFNDDEAAFGYNAYSILNTGRDEWGRFLPFPVFESFGDWKLVGYLYLTVISQFFLGINEFATRFPSAVFGVLAVWATYLLTKELFEKHESRSMNHESGKTENSHNSKFIIHNSEKIGLLAAFFLAISPWHLVASRNAFESDILIFFITLSVYLFLKGLANRKFLTLSLVCFAISFYFYRSAWLFVPVFVLSLIYFHWNQLKKFKRFLARNLVIVLILILPLVPVIMTFRGQSRFFQESFIAGVAKSGIIDDVNERRGYCQKKLPSLTCLFVYNKYISFFSKYVNNYFSNLSPETYYVRGNPGGYQSFSIRGLFYSFELPLFIVGFLILIWSRNPALKILLPWILFIPIGASFTGVGNPGRLNILMPTTQIIAAFGLFSVLRVFSSLKVQLITLATVCILIAISLTRFIVDNFYYYPTVSAKYQRYGYKQLFDYLESQKPKYAEIALSRRSDDAKQYELYLFYEKFNPSTYLEPGIAVRYRGADGWQVVESIENIKFYPSAPGLDKLPPKSLLAIGEKEVLYPVAPIFVVNDLKGDRLFEVYDVDQVKKRLEEIEKI